VFLDGLQSLVGEFYALDLPHDVRDFLTTDAGLAAALDDGGRPAAEKLLINEASDAAEVCLYLEERLVARLTENDPNEALNAANLEDFWTAFEGVSHFVYYTWNAALDKPVTLLEMELQAEVDKFVATTLLMLRQGARPPRDLHRWLFELPVLDPRLAAAERERYRDANRYAAQYCRQLAAAPPTAADVRRDLRRFYRFSQPQKLEHIEAASGRHRN
jgi:hypothetical protein